MRPIVTLMPIVSTLLLPLGSHAQVTNAAHPGSVGNVNARIVEFVQGKLGKKVGRGECWDLAAQALNTSGAIWDGQYAWGVALDPEKEAVLPGDVVQFEDVVFEWEEEGARNRVNMSHHTAVVIEVKSPGVFVIAHQNFGEQGRKVGLGDLVLAHKKKGKVTVFRPQG